MATKPLILELRAGLLTAAIHGLALARWLAFLLTILPVLVWIKSLFLSPVFVLSILPKKAWRLASLAEMTFFFIAVMAFMAAIAFIAFIALAILRKEQSRW